MPAPVSVGLLLYRHAPALEVLLVHPGGPFWRNKDAGAWQLPKGLIEPGEPPAAAALREFAEETGHAPAGEPVLLGEIRQAGGKRVIAFALAGDLDAARIVSNDVSLEWPRGSGRMLTFPEVDRARWFDLPTARSMILPSQMPVLDMLERLLA